MLSTMRTASCSRSSMLFRGVKSQLNPTPIRLNTNATRRAAESRGMGIKPTSLKEKLMAPVGNNPFGIGRGLVAGAAALGIGTLCVYGSGLNSSVGYRERAMIWPQYVKDRVRSTYLYFSTSVGVTALSAAAFLRSPALMRFTASGGILPMLGMLGLMIGSGVVCRMIPYDENNLTMKRFAWLVHSSIIGLAIAPVCFLGGQIVMKAALYTTGIVGGLSAIAVTAPTDKFVNMGAPLAMGLGVVFVSSVAGMFLPPTTALGASLYSISVYGGLVLFSGMLLYDTQKIMKRAEETPPNSPYPYDPINNSISIFLDTVNIFIRLAMIFAGNNRKK